MAYEVRNGEFSLFHNDYKRNDRQPDYKGHGKGMNGEELEIAAWVKEGRNGKFFSVKIAIPQERPQQYAPQQYQQSAPAPMPAPTQIGGPEYTQPADDDLPF